MNQQTIQEIENQHTQLMLDECQKYAANFSSWEEDFLASLAAQFETKGRLTRTQNERLERIWEKI